MLARKLLGRFIAITISASAALADGGAALARTGNTAALRIGDQEASASVSGTVVDAKGSVVADARIAVINDAKGIQRETSTNDAGYFAVPFLPPGNYILTVEMRTFATIRVTGIVLQA